MEITELFDKDGTRIKHNDLIEAVFKAKKGSIPVTTLVRVKGGHVYHVASRRTGGEVEMPFSQEVASLVRVVGSFDPNTNSINRIQA